MRFFKQLFDFYINSSLHVAISGYSMVRVSELMFAIANEKNVSNFVFFGIIVAYNFVKYDGLARRKMVAIRNELKAIAFFSFCSFLMCIYYFFKLELKTQIFSAVFLGITLLYTLPFFPNKENARNWAGIKIYIVTLCWMGVTLILPLLNAGVHFETYFLILGFQRFILIFVLVLIFEIIDLAYDDPHLQTVPQQIGVKRTKNLGYILLIIFCALEFFNVKDNFNIQFSLPLIFAISIALAFANEKRTTYYTSFWVESIPIVWWVLILTVTK